MLRVTPLASAGLALSGLALTMPARAQPVTGPYVSLGAGVDFLQNQPITYPPQFGTPTRTYKFDPGFAGQVSGGWGFGNGLRVEIEGDYTNNHVRETGNVVPLRAGGHEQQYGGFANVLYDFRVGLPLFPYVGIGAGEQVLEADNLNSAGVGAVRPVAPNSNAKSVSGFAYQAIVGASVPLPWVSGLSFTAEYRFVGLLDPLPALPRVLTSATTGERVASGNGKPSNDLNHEILLGLRYVFGAPPAPPPPAPSPVAAPAPSPSRTYLVFFDWDKATLTDRARQIVAEAAQASTHIAHTRIEVNGYTDLSGTPQYNQGLSVRRAEAVAAELARLGVPEAAIGIQGYGETRPLVPTAQGAREPQNRRVEIIIR